MDIHATLDRDPGARRTRFLDALYRQYARPLLRFLSRQNISAEEAKEIVQETYVRMHEVPHVEALEQPRAYLYRTAINLTRDTQRQRRRGSNVTVLNPQYPDQDVASEEPAADRVLSGEQELQIIRAAIAELSPVCRQVFVMHRFESATYKEIAETLGLSVSSIEKYVIQALAQLKKRLDETHRGARAGKP